MAGPGAGNKVTWAGSAALNISGSLNLSGGTAGITRTFTGAITMNATAGGTVTLTSNAITYASAFTFNKTGATFQLVDDLNTTANFTLTAGAFDGSTNSKTVILSGSAQTITPTVPLSFYSLNRTPAAPSTGNGLTLAGNITVTNLFTVSDGATASNRVLVQSSTVGTPRTITAASISLSQADFMDITGAGAAGWNILGDLSNFGSGDCSGNSGITFPISKTRHWINANSGNWSAVANWATSTAGTAGATFPLCQDDVYFDNAFGTSNTVTADIPRLGRNIDWTGATWTTALTWGGGNVSIFGSLTLISGLTSTEGTNTFFGRGSFTIDLKGVVLSNTNGGATINAPGGTYTLSSNFTLDSTHSLILTNGTFNSNSNVISVGAITLSSAGTLTLGTETDVLSGAATIYNNGGGTLNASSSTIKITNSSGGTLSFNPSAVGQVFNNLWIARGSGGGSFTVNGSNTFNNFRDTGSVAESILFTSGTTQNISSWSVSGASSANRITINSNDTSTHALVFNGSGQVCSDFLNIQHSVVTRGLGWYAGSHSVNNQATATAGSGWIFSPCFKHRVQGGTMTIKGGTTTFR